MSDLDLDELLPSIQELKERNSKLEETLRHIQSVLVSPSTTPVTPTKEPITKNRDKEKNNKKSTKSKKSDKKKKKKKSTENGDKKKFVWCGKEGTFDAYRCETCSSIIRQDKIDKHRCLSHNKNRKRKGDKILEQKTPKKKKTSDPITAVVAEVVPTFDNQEKNSDRTTTSLILLEEDDVDHPLYRGNIDGWAWKEYRYGYSCYKCNDCGIVMRHDFIHKHQPVCRAKNHTIVKKEINEDGISLM